MNFRIRRIRHTEQMFCVCGWQCVALKYGLILVQVFLKIVVKDCFGWTVQYSYYFYQCKFAVSFTIMWYY